MRYGTSAATTCNTVSAALRVASLASAAKGGILADRSSGTRSVLASSSCLDRSGFFARQAAKGSRHAACSAASTFLRAAKNAFTSPGTQNFSSGSPSPRRAWSTNFAPPSPCAFWVPATSGMPLPIRVCARTKSGKPRFVLAHTLIGKGIPEVAGTQKAHGEGGAKFVDQARRGLGLPEEKFWVPGDVKAFFAERRKVLAAEHASWRETFAAWRAKNPDLSRQLDDANTLRVPDDLSAKIPSFDADAKLATRKASETVFQVVAAEVPYLMGASADLYGSTFNYI